MSGHESQLRARRHRQRFRRYVFCRFISPGDVPGTSCSSRGWDSCSWGCCRAAVSGLQKPNFHLIFHFLFQILAERCPTSHSNAFGFVAGAVSLAGVESGLWSVKGGNKLVCSGLIYASKAEVIPGTVLSIEPKVRPSRSGEFGLLCCWWGGERCWPLSPLWAGWKQRNCVFFGVLILKSGSAQSPSLRLSSAQLSCYQLKKLLHLTPSLY